MASSAIFEDRGIVLQFLTIALLAIHAYNSFRKKFNLTKSGLTGVKRSAWRKFYNNADEQSFITMLGFTKHAFSQLVEYLFQDYQVANVGRKRSLNFTDRVGLYLMYCGTRCQLKFLSLIFGIVPSIIHYEVIEMKQLIVKKLSVHPQGRIKWPTLEEKEYWSSLVNRREPMARNVIGFVDGLAIAVQCNESEEEQSIDYNGFNCDTRCNNVFAFSPLGKVFFALINGPGSWHDTHVAQPLITHCMGHLFPYCLCVDQGFPRSGNLEGLFVGPISKKRKRTLASPLRDYLIAQSDVHVSLRQSAEWGMRALQGSFSRLTARLSSDRSARRNLILSIILLHNLRTDVMGINQITEVFNEEYQNYISIEGYEKLDRYFQ
jgi:hypothetical protein